ncbi:MAG: protein BatD [Elusimicrobia bacterium]|nr:protein BatD [Elusimicrobiota bacterium]
MLNVECRAKREIYLLLLFLYSIFYILHSTPVWADIRLSLRLDKNKILLGETATLEIAVVGSSGGLGEPKIAIPAELSVYSQSKSQKIEIVNWQMTTSVVYSLILGASKAGQFKLGPARLEAGGGQTITSEVVSLEVADQKTPQIPGTPQGYMRQFPSPSFPRTVQDMVSERRKTKSAKTPSAPAQDSRAGRPSPAKEAAPPPLVFLDAKTDKNQVYVGEAVKFSVLFYTRVPFASQPQYAAPTFSGFWHEDLVQKTFNSNIAGIGYQVTEIPAVIFPTVSGKLQISSAKIQVELEKSQDPFSMDPFDPQFFQRFFGGAGEVHVLETKPLAITASPLPPEGKPKDFSGAVGKFDIRAELDKNELKVGESLTLTVTISGEGNIRSLPSPIYPNLEGMFRSYETEKSETISKDKGMVTGKKIYKLLLIPQIPGRPALNIPAIRFVYFDPQKKEYVRRETQSLSVKVSGEPMQQASSAGETAKQAKTISEDIHYIIEKPPSPHPFTLLVKKLAQRWPAAGATPAIFWLAAVMIQAARKKRALKRRRPLEQLTAAVRQAEQLAAKNEYLEASNIAAMALEKALLARLGLVVSKITTKAIVKEISQKAAGLISQEDLTMIEETLETLHFLRFAPDKSRTGKELIAELLENARRVKTILEKIEGKK